MRFYHVVLAIAAMLAASAQAAPAAHQNQLQGALDKEQSSRRFLRTDKTTDDEERAGEVYHLSKSEKAVAFVKDIVPLAIRRADVNTAYKALKVKGTGTKESAILTWYLKLKSKTALKHTPNGKYITM